VRSSRTGDILAASRAGFETMISIRTMTTDDIPLELKLTRQTGWNQLEADWRRFLAMQPDSSYSSMFRRTTPPRSPWSRRLV